MAVTALASSHSTGSLFALDSGVSAITPGDLDDVASIDEQPDMDLDAATQEEPHIFSELASRPLKRVASKGLLFSERKKAALERSMSTEAEAMTQKGICIADGLDVDPLSGGVSPQAQRPPPISPRLLGPAAEEPASFFSSAGPPATVAAPPMMIATRSILDTMSAERDMDMWGATSIPPEILPSPRQQQDYLRRLQQQKRDLLERHRQLTQQHQHKQRPGGAPPATSWSQLVAQAGQARQRAPPTAPPHAALTTPDPATLFSLASQKKKRRVCKDRPKPKPWSEEELQRFRHLLQTEGATDWAGKAERLGTGRSAKSLHTRWLRDEGRIVDRPRGMSAMANAMVDSAN